MYPLVSRPTLFACTSCLLCCALFAVLLACTFCLLSCCLSVRLRLLFSCRSMGWDTAPRLHWGKSDDDTCLTIQPCSGPDPEIPYAWLECEACGRQSFELLTLQRADPCTPRLLPLPYVGRALFCKGNAIAVHWVYLHVSAWLKASPFSCLASPS